MIFKIIYRKIKISHKKIRILINKIKNYSILNILIYLNFVNNKSSNIIKKLLLSSLNSIKYKFININLCEIKILKFTSEKGTILKRLRFISRGRFSIIKKNFSNIILIFKYN